MKQALIILAFLFFGKAAICQQATYTLPLPAKWGVEKIAFPISFAPAINYKATEEIRFMPGWSDAKSAEYWSYTFVWFIEGTPFINDDSLKQDLLQYYNGLYTSNQKADPAGSKSLTHLGLKKVATAPADSKTYEGIIVTLNFLNRQPLTLNARIHIRRYPAVNNSAVLFEISPQDYKHNNWTQMDEIANGFVVK
ncbi:MAG: hypothetical protein M3O71_17125 [Bacteroidota bacterium]|nr:hypothetical protein [Bacteroidota bacterium]